MTAESNDQRPTNPTDDPSFEELTASLDEIVAVLERGDLSLDESLAAYERGVNIVRRCNDLLDRAELRITELAATTPASGTGELAQARFDDADDPWDDDLFDDEE